MARHDIPNFSLILCQCLSLIHKIKYGYCYRQWTLCTASGHAQYFWSPQGFHFQMIRVVSMNSRNFSNELKIYGSWMVHTCNNSSQTKAGITSQLYDLSIVIPHHKQYLWTIGQKFQYNLEMIHSSYILQVHSSARLQHIKYNCTKLFHASKWQKVNFLDLRYIPTYLFEFWLNHINKRMIHSRWCAL